MRWALVFTALAAVATAHRSADACSCVPQPAYVSPQDGATSVPINARIFVAADHEVPNIVVKDVATQAILPITFDTHARTNPSIAFHISLPRMLRANATYEVTAEGGFAPTITTFSTGSDMDVTPPAFDGLASFEPETMRYDSACVDSCVEGRPLLSRIRLGYPDPAPEIALLVFRLRRSADDSLVEELAIPDRTTAGNRILGFSTCEQRAPQLDPAEHYCASLTAYDVAGNEAGGSVVVCDTARACKPALAANQCSPSETCTVLSSSGGCATTAPIGGAAVPGAVLLVVRSRRRRRGR